MWNLVFFKFSYLREERWTTNQYQLETWPRFNSHSTVVWPAIDWVASYETNFLSQNSIFIEIYANFIHFTIFNVCFFFSFFSKGWNRFTWCIGHRRRNNDQTLCLPAMSTEIMFCKSVGSKMMLNCSRWSMALNSNCINWFWKIQIAKRTAVIGARPAIKSVRFAVICIVWRWTLILGRRTCIGITMVSNAPIIRTRKSSAMASIMQTRCQQRCCVAANAVDSPQIEMLMYPMHWNKVHAGNSVFMKIVRRCWTAISGMSIRMATTFWWNGNATANWYDRCNWMDQPAMWPTQISWRIQNCATNTFRWTIKMDRWLLRPLCRPMQAFTIVLYTRIPTIQSPCIPPNWRSSKSWDFRRSQHQSNWKWVASLNCTAKCKERQRHKFNGLR